VRSVDVSSGFFAFSGSAEQSAHDMIPKVVRPVAADPKMAREIAIGLIGMGDMGRMYAKKLSSAGWR
jgi:phosphoglycerate dehydrogenase-like enzyme